MAKMKSKTIEQLHEIDLAICQVLVDCSAYDVEGTSVLLSRLSIMLAELNVPLANAQNMLADFYHNSNSWRNLPPDFSIH